MTLRGPVLKISWRRNLFVICNVNEFIFLLRLLLLLVHVFFLLSFLAWLIFITNKWSYLTSFAYCFIAVKLKLVCMRFQCVHYSFTWKSWFSTWCNRGRTIRYIDRRHPRKWDENIYSYVVIKMMIKIQKSLRVEFN